MTYTKTSGKGFAKQQRSVKSLRIGMNSFYINFLFANKMLSLHPVSPIWLSW